MKNRTLLFLFILKVSAVCAQYDIVTSPIANSNPPSYMSTVTPSQGTPSFSDQDLITWIFPDGQFKQQEIETDASGLTVINNSNTFTWTPYTTISTLSGPGHVVAYVAKKGGPGNPPKKAESSNLITGNFTGSPAPFAMQPGRAWQINKSWEFSPGKETILILSYKVNPVCDPGQSGKLFLIYDTDKLEMVPGENLKYRNEMITEADINNFTQKQVEIKNLYYNDMINHVYIKLRLKTAVILGSTFNIAVRGSICSNEINDNIQYVAKGTPHDPNEKIVNHPFICDSQPNRADLTYYIKFQNDGNAPVDKVEIEDDLPNELDWNTFSLDNVPNFNNVYDNFSWTGDRFRLAFKNLNLPGLKQTNPHYAYDQTTYEFSFNICTQSNLPPNAISNIAEIYFYDSLLGKLPVVYTNYSDVIVRDTNCYKPLISCIVPTTEHTGIINNFNVSPNPFGDEVQITLELETKTRLSVVVRDLNGRMIEKVTDSEFVSGVHYFVWQSARLSPGVYLLDVLTERGRITRKVIKI